MAAERVWRHPKTQQFTKEVLNHMRERLSDYQEEYGDLYNLEATPAESTAYRLAKHDRAKWPDIKTAGHDGRYPVLHQQLPSAGGLYRGYFLMRLIFRMICRRCTPRELSSMRSLAKNCRTGKQQLPLVRKIAENYKLPYYTLSPTYSVCRERRLSRRRALYMSDLR